jgi:hypothetical protein
LIAAAMLTAAGPALAKGGGGGHGGSHVVVVGVGGYGRVGPLFQGDEAAMTLEVLADAPAPVEGVMKKDDVIAVHALRSADAIVTLAEVAGRHGTVPAGTVLVRMAFADTRKHAVVWCDIRPAGRIFFPQQRDCFEDAKSDGHLDRLWRGDTMVHFLGFHRSGVGYFSDPMPTPIAYRSAKPEERPRALMGFKYCDGDGVISPPRFALAVKMASDETWTLVGACRFGVWPDLADKSKVEMSGMELSVAAAGPAGLRYKLAGRLPAEALGPLPVDGPVVSVTDTSALAASIARVLIPMQPTLRATGKAKINFGTIKVGDVLGSEPMVHTVTGVLRNRIHPTAGVLWPAGTVMEVGQPVFGVPLASQPDGLMWCGPMKREGVWLSYCLVGEGSTYYWIKVKQPVMSPSTYGVTFYNDGVDPASSAPSVTPAPITLPPITLSIRFASVSVDNAGVPANVYHLEVDLDWGDGPKSVGPLTYELPPAGRTMTLLGIPVRLKPVAGSTDLVIEPAPPVIPVAPLRPATTGAPPPPVMVPPPPAKPAPPKT